MERIEHLEQSEEDVSATPLSPNYSLFIQQALIVVITIVIVLALWETWARVREIPSFFLPKPSDIALRFGSAWNDGILARHVSVTWSEALVAFALAFVFSSVLGYVLAKSPLLEKVVSPFIVASQSLPIFAIAPFVLITLGNGFWSNALMGALVAFFPMLVSMIAALRNISDEQRAVMRAYAATRGQVFMKLELPATLPYLFGSIRVGITLSVIGVLVVELIWADRGLGFLLNVARGQFDTPLLFAAVLALVIMNLIMYVTVAILQRLVMPWRAAVS